MIDLHTHTFFSDGTLCPAELMQRAEEKGLAAVALTDHADPSNLEQLLERITRGLEELNRCHQIRALAGVELTHVPPQLIASLSQRARDLGAEVVVVHGETIVEPVPQGTNTAALEACVDVLAHPGLLTAEQARLAARSGHCLGNGRVASLAREAGAGLVINSDAHASRDLIDGAMARKVGLGAGLSEEELAAAFDNAKMFVERVIRANSCRAKS
jgi:histidinol phosphatase-like PHP family hydrolase